MKHKEPVALFLVGALLSGLVATGASEAGSALDPLIALNWLKSTFIPDTVSDAKGRVDQQIEQLNQWLSETGATGYELRVKRGDQLRLSSGSLLVPLAGEIFASETAEDIIDATAGTVLAETGPLSVDHRYLSTANSKSIFSVTSDTAVIRIMGSYQLKVSNEIDYNAMADALKTIGLFRGSDVPYGSGYELEAAPTRIQGLIMFLRLMGEEAAALQYPGSGITFADVPDWALPYVAYAYDKGYTKGQEVNSQWQVVFGTNDPLASRDYVTFLLRALGYQEGKDFQWLTAAQDARTLGLLTDQETQLITEGAFLRAQVTYLSYQALFSRLAGESSTLLDRLISDGIVTKEMANRAISAVSS